MGSTARYEREWEADRMNPAALGFILDEALEAVRVSDAGTESLSVEITAHRTYRGTVEEPFDHAWRLRVSAFSESEHDDRELLERGKIPRTIFNARRAQREEER